MSHWLDNLARRAAGGAVIERPLTRRRLIGTTAGAAAAATVVPAFLPADAQAACGTCGPNEFCCDDGSGGICCPNDHVCCTGGAPGGQGTTIGCCRPGQTCTFLEDGSGACAGCPTGFTACETDPENGVAFTCCHDAEEFCAEPESAVCCPHGSTVCGEGQNIDCCDPNDDCIDGDCVTGCAEGETRCGIDCCPEGFECEGGECKKVCEPDELSCANDCCPPGWICEHDDTGIDICTDPCPSGETACGPGVCCGPDEVCKDGECTTCKFGEKECGQKCCPESWECCVDDAGKSHCCPPGRFCCDPALELCCANGETCCFDAVGKRTCCPPGVECAKMILPGDIGITPASPLVCCPPERYSTAVPAGVCCPPGSVKNPSGFSTRGGLCCTQANVCGDDCCDSTPLLPLECCGGKCCGPTDIFTCVDGMCVRREDARPTPAKQVTVNDRGEALILVSCGSGGGCSGSVTIQTPGAGGSSISRWAVPVVGARRFVFGSRRFKLPAGRSTKVKVRLTRVGLKTLRKRKKARVVAVVRTVDERNGAVVNTSKPFTLKAPKVKKRRR